MNHRVYIYEKKRACACVRVRARDGVRDRETKKQRNKGLLKPLANGSCSAPTVPYQIRKPVTGFAT